MKVLIDISKMHKFSLKRGIGVYTTSLFESLQELAKTEDDFYIKLNRRPKVDYDNYDLIFFPFFDLFFNTLPYRYLKKSLVMVHDVIPLRFKKHYPAGVRGQLRFYWQHFKLKHVAGIITNSSASKRDIVKFLWVNPKKIYPIYLAGRQLAEPDHKTQKEIKEKYGLFDHYLFYLGDVNYHKNLASLIRSLKYLPAKVNLVLAGSGFNSNSIERFQLQRLIKKLGLAKRIKMMGYLNNQTLAVLYQLADFYIQPSLWEGFGLPVVEAISLGTPVIVSRNSSLREITNNKVATYIKHPFNSKKIAEAIKEAYQKKPRPTKDELIKFADRFSWSETAKKTYQVYKEVYGKRA